MTKMRKRLYAMALVVALCLSMLPTAAWAAEEPLTPETPVSVVEDEGAPQEALVPKEEQGELAAAAPSIQGYTQVTAMPSGGLEAGYYLIVVPVGDEYYVLFPGATGQSTDNVRKLWKASGDTYTGLAKRTETAKSAELTAGDNLILKSEGDADLYSVTAQGPSDATYALFVGSNIIYSNGGASETRIVKYENGFGICNNHSAKNDGYSYLGYYGASNQLFFGQGWHAYNNVVLREGDGNAYENFMLYKSDTRTYETPLGDALRTGMFNTTSGDNTWAVTGGRAAQGSFADIGNARSVAGHFEEYIRWTNGGGSDGNAAARMAMQRFVVDTAYADQTLADIVSQSGWARITALDPKAALYMAGPEDVTEAAAPAAFSTNLQSFITKSLALREGKGYAAIMKPYKTTDAAYNTKVDSYNAAIDAVVKGLTTEERSRVIVVDSVALTGGQLTSDGKWPNAMGTLALAMALSQTATGNTLAAASFPNARDATAVTDGTWAGKLTTDGPALPRSAPATLSAAQQTIKTKVGASAPMTWLFMGDSITHGALWAEGQATLAQGFEKFVKDDLGRKTDIVINTGVSGATTDTTVETLADRLDRYSPDVVTIMLGTNDAKNLNEATYKANLRTILDAVTGNGAGQKGAIAVLRTPIPNNRSDAGGANVHLCAQYVREVAQESAYADKVIVMDQFAEWSPYMMVSDSSTDVAGSTFLYGQVFTSDRLHPGPRGHLWMTQELIESLGLWDGTKTTCKLRYPLDSGKVTTETNSNADLSGLFRVSADGANSTLTVHTGELVGVTGLGVQHVVYAEVSTTVGSTPVSKTAFRDSGVVALEGLSDTGTYSITIKALVQTAADAGKLITFVRNVDMASVTPELTVQGYTQVKTLPEDGLEEGYYLIVAPVNGHYYVLYPGAVNTGANVVNAKELTVDAGTMVGTGLADSLTLDKADNLVYKDELNGNYFYNVTAQHDANTTYQLVLQSSPVYETSGTSSLTITQSDPGSGAFRIRGASTLCYHLPNSNFNQMSTELVSKDCHYDMLLFRKDGAAPSRGYGTALRMGMFPPNSIVNDDGFNSWVFTGGRAAQGLIADIGNARNYMGVFEEYNRGNGPGNAANGNEIVYQRHTINTASSGQTLAQVVSNDGWSRVTALDPRAVSYLVGVEDMKDTQDATITAFKADLNTFITKSLALRGGKGFAVIQKPYKTTDATYNAKVDAYNAAIDQVTDALSGEVQSRIVVVPSVTLTAEQLSKDGYPNDKGHWQLAYQFTQTVMGVTFSNPNQFPSRFPREYDGVMNQVWVNRASTEPTSYVQGTNLADADLTPAQKAIKDKMAAGNVTWLFMGDSITHGLGYAQGQATLAQAFEKFVRDDLGRTGDTVINTAVSGAGTRTTLAGTCIDARLKKYDADVVSIMLGTNDAANGDPKADYVTVTADQYRANLRTLVHLIIDPAPAGKGAIAVLRTPIATVENSLNRNANITTFAGIMKEVYEEFESTGKVILIDQHTEWANYLKTAYSGTGASFLYKEVYSQTISGNALHPGPIGHLWMTHEFIDGLGLWDDSKYICKLHYSVNGVTAETSTEDISSSITPGADKTSLSLQLSQLDRFAGSGQPVPVIRAELTAQADGKTVTAEAFGIDGSGAVTLTGLDPAKTYSVTVKALVQTAADAGKSITFGPYDINMADSRVEVSKEVSHKTTDTKQENYFVFSQGNWSEGKDSHVWSNTLGSDPTATWYEVHFTGHKIDVYAGKNFMMNKVKYYIDGKEVGTYDLYNASNIDSTFIASFGGLTEGDHVFKAVATSERNASASGSAAIDCAKVIVYSYMDLENGLFGGIVSDNLQYVQADYQTVIQQGAAAKTLNAWKNDIAVSQIALASGGQALSNVTITVSNFTGPNGASIPASAATATFVKSVQAYTGMPGYGDPNREVPQGNRAEASEVLYQTSPLASMPAGSVQPVWLSISVPKDAAAGTYTGTVTVSATGLTTPLTLTYTLVVADAVLPDATTFKDTFDIELWQNPFASAEYYSVTPFSQEHFAILKPIMEKYKSIGGHAITTTIVDEAWAGQTYSKNAVHIPTMIQWTKKADGTWSFDYTDFDAWVTFNKNLGIGDKIVCYSVAPWNNTITYKNASGGTATIASSDATAWNAAWTAFLTDLMTHTEAKGWKDQIYIGIDERGFSTAAFDLIDSVKGTDGEPFLTAGAMDGFVSKRDLAMRVDDLNVGSIAVKDHPTEFEALRADREAAGLRTTVYSCTGHCPGNFSLSAPGESYWTMMYSYSVGGQGFLRWAYDSWVADPLRDTTHNAFEAGDCFLIFPDEKANKASAKAFSSLRLEKMAEGVRDVNKLMKIKADCPAMESQVDALMASVLPKYEQSGYYLTAAGKAALASDMSDIKAKITILTEEYLERMASGDTKKLNLRPKDVPLVVLPEEYQSDVEGPHPDQEAGANGRRYLGQPDMIQTPEGTLVTAFPQGHGCGPLVMKMSTDRGETWTEIDTPDSWDASLETPTMYRLDFTNGTHRYLMITGRPNWSGNTKGGWDVSISDDAIHWSESTTYHPTLPGGGQNWTIVAMGSLVQLKDENGNFIDKWMGVYHDYGFVNYKTYLTFDAQGNMQWSAPEPYLSDYRALEQKYHICEVGMFRSPDGSRIMALARSDYHNNVHASTMFWSDDEGETWSKPVEMQGALSGERHKARYDPISGRLVITFREIIWDTNNNGVFEGANDWLAGDWIAWVGTYEDLMERNEGQYRILLDEDWANNTYSGDTGYTGMSVFEDGTYVLDTYGHWDKAFSQSGKYDVRQDLCWIRQAKFTLEQIDGLYDQQREEGEVNRLTELDSTVLAANASANSEMNPASGSDGPAAYAFDDQARWWHSRYSGTAGAGETASSGHPSADNHIWIQTGFGEERFIKELTYQTRSNGACAINGYEVQLACLADPTATPTDSDFKTVKTGNLASTASAQTITLDNAYKATHIRLMTTTAVHGSNDYVTAQRIRIYAAGTGVEIGGSSAPLAKPTTPGSVTVSNVTETTATVTWTASTSENGNITQYRLFLNDARTPYRTVTDAAQHTFTLPGLTAGTAYTVKVVAADVKGQVSEAGTATFTTAGTTIDPPTPTAPTAPGSVTVTNITDTAATVTWTASTSESGSIAQYQVFLGDATTPTATVTGLTANLTGLTAATSYTVKVVAVDNKGQTSQPGTATFTTTSSTTPPTPSTPPTAPGNVTVSNITATGATVTWAASTSEGGSIAEYRVFLSGAAEPTATVTGLTADLTGLTAKTTYSVQVVAVDNAGQTSQPGIAVFTTKSSGSVTPPSSGPSGGAAGTPTGGSSLPTQVTKNEDGSTTTVTTDPATGKVTETVQKADGSMLITVTTSDGSLTVLAMDAAGAVMVNMNLPAEIPGASDEDWFVDVPQDHWAAQSVNKIAALGVVNGVGEQRYDPAASMTRGGIATVLFRLANGTSSAGQLFQDVHSGAYYADAVAWAAKRQVVRGVGEDLFLPDQAVTRQEFAVMLRRYARLIGMNSTPDAAALGSFVDKADIGDWAVDDMAWCVSTGILQGKLGNALDPTAQVSRAEVAVMLSRFITLVQK